MAARDRIRWDAAYREQAARPYPAADPLLFQFTPPLRKPLTAIALDLAAGLGQNGLWLADQGYLVNLIDVSRVGLTAARTEAARRRLHNVNFFQLDLDRARLDAAAYDLICVFRFLDRRLMAQIRAATKPGGRIIYQTLNTRYLAIKPEMNPDYLLAPGELAGFFGDWKILHNSEPEHISQIVAIKTTK